MIHNDKLALVREELGSCTRCKLAVPTRKNIVFGAGNPNAKLVMVGEAPGIRESDTAIPFIGPAGQVLRRMLATANIDVNDVYLCNTIKCQPPGNRNPEKDELEACTPFLAKQIEAIQPKIIMGLGKFAMQFLIGAHEKAPISKIRGKWYKYKDIPVMITWHPSYVMRLEGSDKEEEVKWQAWNDLQQVIAKLNDL